MTNMIDDRFSEIQQAEAFLERLFGNRKGYVSMAFGHNPRMNKPRFAKGDFRSGHYAWPEERDQLIGDVDDLLNSPETKHENIEVFINPALRKEPNRKIGTAAPLKWIWCDVDHTPTKDEIERMNALGAMTVLSGTNGNRHVYIELEKPVTLVAHRALERLLARALNAPDKISENDLLRLPGTWNWKSHEPQQVWLKSIGLTTRRPRSLKSLYGMLESMSGLDYDELKAQAKEELQQYEETTGHVDPRHKAPSIAKMPELVRKAYLYKPAPGKRNDAIFNLVAACKENGLSRDDTHALLWTYSPAVSKWSTPHRISNDVDRIWRKVHAEEPEVVHDQEDDGTEQPSLKFHRLSDLADRVDKAPKPEFLFKDIIVQGDYGILSAQDKAGKSFAMADAGVSAASGTAWMNRFDTITQGAVIMCLGEGSERKQVRRLRAIGEHKGLSQEETDNLPIYILLGVPQVREDAHLTDLENMMRDVKPVLLIIDPFYLAAAGIDFSKLADVGQALQGIQIICQRYNCSLMLSHHWNKTGNGDPHSRTSGVGLTAWGRFLISVELPNQDFSPDPETGRTSVLQRWHIKGDEVLTESFDVKRTVWAEDQSDLTSPMHYELHLPDYRETEKQRPLQYQSAMEKVSEVLSDNLDGLTSKQINLELPKKVPVNTLKTVLDQLVVHEYVSASDSRTPTYYHLKSFSRKTASTPTIPKQRRRGELREATARDVDMSKAVRPRRRKTSSGVDPYDV
jgi:hypothetical protein